jgi:hypothetical protein
VRIHDPELLKQLHLEWKTCILCDSVGLEDGLSLHHVHRHPRNDVRSNLVMLCGDGVRGCHGKIEAHHQETLELLGRIILAVRTDIFNYLAETLGSRTAAREWVRRQLRVE